MISYFRAISTNVYLHTVADTVSQNKPPHIATLHYRSLLGVSLFWPSHISIRGWVIKEQWEH